ncbi:MAG: AhpC/TSA family protein [Bacteroidales bacterium]|nr:AhpC/TSA family protein [Bacteroidales bacterium]
MKRVLFFSLLSLFVLVCCNTNSTHYCTVKGTVKGLEDGTKLELENEFNHFEIVGKGVVKNGTFEINPNVSAPTHVYLYTKDGEQLKDFFLEPGTIIVNVDASDEKDYLTGATGTLTNEISHKYRTLVKSGNQEAAKALMDSVLDAEQTGVLALYFAPDYYKSSTQALSVLDRLSPELAKLEYVADLREELTRRLKTDPGKKYINMEYPDRNGKPISLSSVINNPNNRYVLIDLWATWCESCVEMVPELVELYAKYHEKGFEIYSLSMDPESRYDMWKTFIAENKMNWINVCDRSGGRENSKVWHNYALGGIPTTLLIDCQTGNIIARNEPELDKILDKLLTTQNR